MSLFPGKSSLLLRRKCPRTCLHPRSYTANKAEVCYRPGTSRKLIKRQRGGEMQDTYLHWGEGKDSLFSREVGVIKNPDKWGSGPKGLPKTEAKAGEVKTLSLSMSLAQNNKQQKSKARGKTRTWRETSFVAKALRDCWKLRMEKEHLENHSRIPGLTPTTR